MAEINPGGSPTIMLDGHVDEIGLIVQYIDDDGFVYPSPIGGWDPQVLVGQRIRFLGRGGDVIGVIGKKPIHLMKVADRDAASKITDLWVDIGAASRAEAEGRLSVGDPGVITRRPSTFEQSHRLAVDDAHWCVRHRGAAPYAQNLTGARRRCRDHAGGIAWHGGGAHLHECINPQMAIVVDVTFATDHPSVDKKEIGDHRIGGDRSSAAARSSRRSSSISFGTTADRQGIKYSVHAVGRDTSTTPTHPHRSRGCADRARLDSQFTCTPPMNCETRRRRQDLDADRRRPPVVSTNGFSAR
jgi:endoglucanase